MREEYDFSNGRKNPYTEKLKEQIPYPLPDADQSVFIGLCEAEKAAADDKGIMAM